MLAKILNHPDAPVDAVIDEFCAAFGPARNSVKQYFQLWESIYPDYSAEEQASQIDAKRRYGAGIYGPYYFLADEIYTPAVMTNAWSILAQARDEAAPDETAAARVEWLAKGLQHADLILAAARAYERKIDTGNDAEFVAAVGKAGGISAEQRGLRQRPTSPACPVPRRNGSAGNRNSLVNRPARD